MRWLGLLAVCGCNQAFDLKSTKLADSHPDAAVPAACPAIGSVPRFSDDMKQIPPRSCDGYTVSEHDTAMAMCRDPQGVTWLMGGAADAELANVIAMDMAYQYDLPRLAPDGDRLFISHADTTTTTGADQIIEFAWSGTTVSKMASYTAPHDYQYGAEYFEISTPSRGPDHHILYTDYNYTTSITELVEIADGTGAFKEINRYPVSELGDTMTAISRPSLSPDGLRLVFLMYDYSASGGGATTNGGGPATSGAGTDLPPGGVIGGGGLYCQGGGNVVMYADRATTSDHFGKAMAMETLPNMVDYPYMTEDCGRIYVSALNRVFYFKQ